MSYSGDVTTREAMAAVTEGHGVIVDCRTVAEWTAVGIPDVASLVLAEWQPPFPGAIDTDFVTGLGETGLLPETPIYFLCRSGQRSMAAASAAAAAGFTNAFNIVHGFEGPIGPDGRRSVAGWKADGLAWRQYAG